MRHARAMGREKLMTYEEVAELEGVSRRTVYNRVKRGDYRAVETGRILENGRPEKRIPASCLESDDGQDDQPCLPDRRQEDCPSETKSAPSDLPDHIPTLPSGAPDVEGMKECGLGEQVDEYERRMRAVSRVESILERPDPPTKTEARQQVGTEFEVSARTIRRWQSLYEDYGWTGLMPRWGREKGYRSLPEEIQKRVLDAYTWQGKKSATQIYRDVVKPSCDELGVDTPHPRTVRRFLKEEVPPLVEDMSREGKEFYEKHHKPRVQRELPTRANQWWSSDNRRADTFVRVADGKGRGWPSSVQNDTCPCGSGRKRKNCCSVRRPWWCLTADIASGAIVGLRVTLRPDSSDICQMLKDAVQRFGLPEHWQRDNGLDYQARRLGEDGPPTESGGKGEQSPLQKARSASWKALGVTVHSCLPYHSWSKYAESIFAAFAKRIENRFPGWCGNRPDNRPEKLEKELERGEILTLKSYCRHLAQAWGQFNTNRPIGDRNKPPMEFWGDIEPDYPSEEALAFLLQRRGEQKVRSGYIEVDGERYSSSELAVHSGLKVRCRWVGKKPDEVLVWTPREEWLVVGRAKKGRYGEFGEANEQAKRAARAQRAFVCEFAEEVKGTCPRELVDPYGAHAEVQKEQEERRQHEREAAQSLPEVTRREAERIGDAEKDTGEDERSEWRPSTAYRAGCRWADKRDSLKAPEGEDGREVQGEAEKQAESQKKARRESEKRATGTDGPERNKYSHIVDLL